MHLFEVTGRSLTRDETSVLRDIGAATRFGGLDADLLSLDEKRITNKLILMGYVIVGPEQSYHASEDGKRVIG